MAGGGLIDAIYTDHKAAFDRVDHILLQKLERLGASHCSISWLRSYSYLVGRSLSVKLRNGESESFTNL